MSDRFSFEDQSTASRVQQYEAAVVKIKEHPLIGNGYFELDGKPIHNLFLSSWVHAGLAAFVLVLAFYLALLGRWLSILLTVITYPERWVIPIAFEWIAPLPILPLFRVWLSGDGGHLFLGEWLALSAFLGIVLANDLKRRSLARRLAVAVRTAPIEPASIRPAM
jgi:O-antigen ligase